MKSELYKGFEIVLVEAFDCTNLFDVYKHNKLVLGRVAQDIIKSLIDNGTAEESFQKVKINAFIVLENEIVTNYQENLYFNLRMYFRKVLGEVQTEANIKKEKGIVDFSVNGKNYEIVFNPQLK